MPISLHPLAMVPHFYMSLPFLEDRWRSAYSGKYEGIGRMCSSILWLVIIENLCKWPSHKPTLVQMINYCSSIFMSAPINDSGPICAKFYQSIGVKTFPGCMRKPFAGVLIKSNSNYQILPFWGLDPIKKCNHKQNKAYIGLHAISFTYCIRWLVGWWIQVRLKVVQQPQSTPFHF